MDTLTDNVLLHRIAAQRDRDAFTELVRRHAAMVHRTACRLCPSGADDIAQAVFLLLWQQPARAAGSVSLAAWLHRATVYTCRNAQRMQLRRDHHEREAAMQRSTSTPERPEEILAILDESLNHLSDKCRQAVLLRYLEGLTAQEAASRLGTSAHAVAKQAERGIEKIRNLLLSRGYSIPAGSIIATFATESAHRAPEMLLHALAQVPQAAPATVASLATQTAKALAATKVKAAATIAAVAILAGIGIAARAVPADPSVAASQPAPVIAPVAAEDEKAVPGVPHVYRYEMLIEDGLCQAILKDATPITAQGDFKAYRMPSRALREWLTGAPEPRVLYAYEHGPSLEQPENAPGQQIGFANFYSFGSTINYTDRQQGNLTAASRGGISGQMWTDAAGVHFPFRENTWKVEIAGIAGGRIEKEGGLSVDTTAAPGEHLLFVLPIGQLWDGQYSYVVAMEVFNATPQQGAWIRDLRTSKDWVAYGPGLCRRIADQIIAYAKDGHLPEEVPDRWRKTLSDGTVVTLQGLRLPRRWLGISWDGDGKPLKGFNSSWNASDDSVRVNGQVRWTTAPMSMMENGRLWGQFNTDKLVAWNAQCRADGTAVHGRIGVGAFKSAGVFRKGQPMEVGPFKLTMNNLETGPREWQISYVVEGPAAERKDYVLVPVAVTRTGERVGPEQSEDERGHWSDQEQPVQPRQTGFAQFVRRAAAPFNQDEFDHIELLWRKTELVRFEAFANAPATPPALDLGKEIQVIQAGRPSAKVAAISKTEIRKDDLLAEEERPSATLEKLIAAMNAGDAREMRKYIAGSPAACEAFADGLAARAKLINAARKRFGSINGTPMLQKISRFDECLRPGAFTIRDDGIATAGQVVCRPGDHGWVVDLSESFYRQFDRPSDQAMIRQMSPRLSALADDLNSGKVRTLPDLNAALDALARDAQAANR